MKPGDEILVRADPPTRAVDARVVRVRGDELCYRYVPNTLNWADHGSEKLRMADRGVTWAPAWRTDEAKAFRATLAL